MRHSFLLRIGYQDVLDQHSELRRLWTQNGVILRVDTRRLSNLRGGCVPPPSSERFQFSAFGSLAADGRQDDCHDQRDRIVHVERLLYVSSFRWAHTFSNALAYCSTNSGCSDVKYGREMAVRLISALPGILSGIAGR